MAAQQAPPSLGSSRQEHWSGLPFPSPMHESEKWKWSHVRLLATPWTTAHQALRPWDFPGKSTGVGCHCLLHPTFYQQSYNGKLSSKTWNGQPVIKKSGMMICQEIDTSWKQITWKGNRKVWTILSDSLTIACKLKNCQFHKVKDNTSTYQLFIEIFKWIKYME